MPAWEGSETADITYRDVRSVFTSLLIEKGYLEEVWREARPNYFIEVKTTTGLCGDRFFLSTGQYSRVRDKLQC